jgi:hypothetical protein
MKKPNRRSPTNQPPGSGDLFDRWMTSRTLSVGRHNLSLFLERDGARDSIMKELREIVRSHYVAPEITAKRLAELGAPETAAIFKEHLPVSKQARSGDLGEIFATELAERELLFRVPIRRLRWKDGRNMALRGDDIFAVVNDSKIRLRFLKGESKSRSALRATVVTEAAEALDRNRGRPTRHSVLFVADRLREQGQDQMAKELENAVLQGFRRHSVEHLLFTLSGNSPDDHLESHLASCKKRRRRHAIGVRIRDHSKFIKRLYARL